MGILEFIFALVLLVTVGAFGVTALLGRAAWLGGKRLLGMIQERKRLTEGQHGAAQEARDVVVEPVEEYEDLGADPSDNWQRAQTPAERARAARKERAARDTAYRRLDVDAGTTAEQIVEVMEGYVDDRVLGERAEGVIVTLDSMRRREQSLMAELDATFQHGSLSWDKFAGPIQAGLDALLRNSAQLGNRIQAFDSAGYQRLFKSVQQDAAGMERTGVQTRSERLRLYQEMLASLDALQETNEGLLLELDKLASELGDIQRDGASTAESATLDEIRRLVDEAKYYRNH